MAIKFRPAKFIFILLLLFIFGKDKYYDPEKIAYLNTENSLIRIKKKKIKAEEFNSLKERLLKFFPGFNSSINRRVGEVECTHIQKPSVNIPLVKNESIKYLPIHAEYNEQINQSFKVLASLNDQKISFSKIFKLNLMNMEAANFELKAISENKKLLGQLFIKTSDKISSLYSLQNSLQSQFNLRSQRPEFFEFCRDERDFSGYETHYFLGEYNYSLKHIKNLKNNKLKKDRFKVKTFQKFLDPLTLFIALPFLQIDNNLVFPLIIDQKGFLAFVKNQVEKNLIHYQVSLVSLSSISQPFQLRMKVRNNPEREIISFSVDTSLGVIEAN